MFQNLLKLMVPLSKYNVLKIKVIFCYFKQEYVTPKIVEMLMKPGNGFGVGLVLKIYSKLLTC